MGSVDFWVGMRQLNLLLVDKIWASEKGDFGCVRVQMSYFIVSGPKFTKFHPSNAEGIALTHDVGAAIPQITMHPRINTILSSGLVTVYFRGPGFSTHRYERLLS